MNLGRSTRSPQCTESQWVLSSQLQGRTRMILRHRSMKSRKWTARCWTMYSACYTSHSPLHSIPEPSAVISTFSVEMVTSSIVNSFYHHAVRIALGIVTYNISTGMSVYAATVNHRNVNIISFWASDTLSWITTNIECTSRVTQRQRIPNSHGTLFTNDSTCLMLFPVSSVSCWSPTSSMQCWSVCLATTTNGLSTSYWCTNGSTSTMYSGLSYLLIMTTHQTDARWGRFSMKWAGDTGHEPAPAWSCYQVSMRWNSLQHPIINHATVSTQAMWDVYMFAGYKSRHEAAFSYMQDLLHRVPIFKDLFWHRQTWEMLKAKTNALRTEHMKKWKVDYDTRAEHWTPSNRRCELNACWEYISQKINESKVLDAYINFRKIN